jgi:epi-isozizaene 5-monooxygenase
MTTAASTPAPPELPGALPVLGHAAALLRDPLEFLRGLRAHGEVVALRLGPRRVYAVTSPELVGTILTTHGPVMHVGGRLWDNLLPLLGDGLAVTNGDQHRRQRLTTNPALTPKRIQRYAPIIQDEVDRMIDWQPGQVVNVDDAAFIATGRIIARCLVQSEELTRRADQIAGALATAFGEMIRRVILPGWLHRLTPVRNRRYQRALARLHSVVRAVVEERRAATEQPDDLVGMLMSSIDEAGKPLGDQEIHDNIINFLVAGTGNVAGAVAWAVHLVAEHPEQAAQLADEIDALGHPPTVADLPALPHTRHVVLESIRYRPTGWVLTRRAVAPVILGGYTLPAGADILYSTYAMQFDLASFPDPDEFDPDRWQPDRPVPPRYAMIPFGTGGRKCPGEHLSMTEIALMLAAIVARWRCEPVPATDTTPRIGITLHPRRPLLRIQPRHTAPEKKNS